MDNRQSVPAVGTLPSLVLALLTVCSLTIADDAAATPVLIHHFSFDGPTVADSVGTATGSLNGGAALGGGNLSLDGINDYVQLNQKIVPTGLAPFSVTVYARQSSAQSGIYVEMISQGQSGSAFYIGHDPFRNIRLGDQFCCPYGIGIPFPSDGAFHFYGLTSDATGTRFYIDSLLAFSSPTQENTTSGGTDTRFGKQYAGWAEFFHGLIDDVRVYDGALTAAEIEAVRGQVVPEPAGVLLLVIGLLGLAAGRARSVH